MKLPLKRRQLGIAATVLAVLILAGTVSIYAIQNHSNQKAKTTISGKSEYTFAGSKSEHIYGYAAAPASLQQTLIDQYYDQAKSNCIASNESVSQNVQSDQVLHIDKLAGNFALVQFCGSGGDTIFDYIAGSWKIIGSTADYPDCSLVDQYKISKQIVSQCYQGPQGALVSVTYP